MKNLETKLAVPPEPKPMVVNLAGVAELYAAACALEPSDPSKLDGLGDLSRVSMATTAGSMRALMNALAMMRGAQ